MDRRLHLLVVDDEPSSLRALERALSVDFRVTTAQGGAEAMDLLRRNLYHAVVTDFQMPDVDGAALVAWLERYRPPLAGRVVVVTGVHDAHPWIEANRHRVFFKPVRANELAIFVRALVKRGT
jgi:DNA-binding NtrC family response regulator